MDRRNFFSLVGTALAAVLCPWTRKAEAVDGSLAPAQLPEGWLQCEERKVARARELLDTFRQYDLAGTAPMPALKGTIMPYCGPTPPSGWVWQEEIAYAHGIDDPGHSHSIPRYIRKI
jgi:hypothetical protein